jgi:hypothetical protein
MQADNETIAKLPYLNRLVYECLAEIQDEGMKERRCDHDDSDSTTTQG